MVEAGEAVQQVEEAEVAEAEAEVVAVVVEVAVAVQCADCFQWAFLWRFSPHSSHCYHSWSLKIASLICFCAVIFLSFCHFCSSCLIHECQ